jgi:hypothetical protein
VEGVAKRTSGKVDRVLLIEGGAEPDPSGRAWGRFHVPGLLGWEVEVEIELQTGELVELRVFRAEGQTGALTRRAVQGLPVGAMHRRLLERVRDSALRAASGEPVVFTTEDAEGHQRPVAVMHADPLMQAEQLKVVEALKGRRRGGPPGRSELEKALLARDYVSECVAGSTSLSAFAKVRNYSPDTISNRISGLRTEGYLPKLQPGEKNPGKPWGWETEKTTGVIAAANEGED